MHVDINITSRDAAKIKSSFYYQDLIDVEPGGGQPKISGTTALPCLWVGGRQARSQGVARQA